MLWRVWRPKGVTKPSLLGEGSRHLQDKKNLISGKWKGLPQAKETVGRRALGEKRGLPPAPSSRPTCEGQCSSQRFLTASGGHYAKQR